MTEAETFEPAFSSPPGPNLAGIPVAHLDLRGPSISYGLPYHLACEEHVKNTYNASRVFVIASASLSRDTGKLDILLDALGKKHVAGVRKGMASHSLWSEILEVTEQARSTNADCIVTLGAGSLTDAAKLATFCLANNISTSSHLATYALGSPVPPETLIFRPTLPIITIPTTLSGGEYFALAGGTNDTTSQKAGFLHSGMGADLVLLDPALYLTTPPYHWLSTGVRALDHCVEALCSLSASTASDARAEKGLRLLVPGLLACKRDARDVEARWKRQIAVRYAMENVRAGVPMGGSHAIGHQLGALRSARLEAGARCAVSRHLANAVWTGPLGVPHGVTSCIMCPAVMKYNLRHGTANPSIARRQALVQEILWSEAGVASVLEDFGRLVPVKSDLGDVLDVLIRFLELPRLLRDLHVPATKIPGLAKNTLDDFWALTNPVPLVEAAQVKEILEMVM